MDDPHQQAAAVAARVRDFVKVQLREQYPWMKDEELENIAESQGIQLRASILEQEPAMAATKQRTNFFSLSAELRNEIYELALIEETAITTIDVQAFPHRVTFPPTSMHGLLRTCAQVRSEALPIDYSSNIFQVKHTWPLQFRDVTTLWGEAIGRPLLKWLRAIGPKRADCIKELCLSCFPRSGFEIGRAEVLLFAPLHTRECLFPRLGLAEVGMVEKHFTLELKVDEGRGYELSRRDESIA